MKKKQIKKITESLFLIIATLSLFLLGASLIALIWGRIYENPILYLSVSGTILIVLLVLGKVTWKRIKNKFIDIFT